MISPLAECAYQLAEAMYDAGDSPRSDSSKGDAEPNPRPDSNPRREGIRVPDRRVSIVSPAKMRRESKAQTKESTAGSSRRMSRSRDKSNGAIIEAETIASLNVGGKVFQTTVSTLRADDQSKIFDMFGTKNLDKILKDPEGRFFLDLDPGHFAYVLGYLRVIKSLIARKGALRPSRHTNEVRSEFRMYGRNIEVRDIWLGDASDPCNADELLEHLLPSSTEALYGVLYQAEYFGLHHLKSILSKRLAKGNTVGFLLEDVLETLGQAHGTERPKTRVSRHSFST